MQTQASGPSTASQNCSKQTFQAKIMAHRENAKKAIDVLIKSKAENEQKARKFVVQTATEDVDFIKKMFVRNPPPSASQTTSQPAPQTNPEM